MCNCWCLAFLEHTSTSPPSARTHTVHTDRQTDRQRRHQRHARSSPHHPSINSVKDVTPTPPSRSWPVREQPILQREHRPAGTFDTAEQPSSSSCEAAPSPSTSTSDAEQTDILYLASSIATYRAPFARRCTSARARPLHDRSQPSATSPPPLTALAPGERAVPGRTTHRAALVAALHPSARIPQAPPLLTATAAGRVWRHWRVIPATQGTDTEGYCATSTTQ